MPPNSLQKYGWPSYASEIGLPSGPPVLPYGLSFDEICHLLRELGRVLLVVVRVPDVRLRHAVRVPGRVEHRTAGVGGLGGQEHRAGHVVELGDPVVQQLVRLVQRAPADDARVAVVAFDRLEPLADVRRGRLLVVLVGVTDAGSPVAELAPDQVPEPVRVVQEPLLEHLLVQARAVEPGRQAELDVADQRLLGRRGHQALRPVPLVQHEPLEHVLAVDQDRLAVDAHRPQTGVRVGSVDHVAVGIDQLEAYVVQVRIRGVPEADAVGRDLQGQARGQVEIGADLVADDLAVGVLQGGLDRVAGLVRRDRYLEVEAGARDVRRDPGPLQVHRGDRFEPDGLPDAGRAGVEAAVVEVQLALLAARLRTAVRVAGADDDGRLLAGLGDVVQVGAERGESAAVPDHLLAVHPDGGVVVDGLEVQYGVLAVPLRGDRDGGAVPDRLHEVDVLDPGQLGLRRERYDDPLRQLAVTQAALQPGVRPVDLELPLAVEVHPLGADELRTRVLRTRLRHCVSRGA